MRKRKCRNANKLRWKFVATVFVLSRLWTALFVYIGHLSHTYLEPVPNGWSGVHNWWLNPWTTFDSYHFIKVALQGYAPQSVNFFPLYPFLLSLAGNNSIVLASWGIVLSNVAFLIALFYFYGLARLDCNGRSARIAVLALAFFPSTAFFSAVYSESLFLLLSVAAFYYVRKNRWIASALCAGLAALTRNSGILLAVMLALEWWHAKRRNIAMPKAAWLAPIAPLITFAAFQGFVARRFGGLLYGVQAQQMFNRHLSWPWTPIYQDITHLFPAGTFHPDAIVNVAVAILAFVLVWRCWKKFPLSYSVFVLGIDLMNLCYSWVYWPHAGSSARFQMATFPFSEMLACEVSLIWKRRLSRLLITIIYLSICAVMCWLFGKKSFIG
jgi:hypothetical protein